MKWWFYIVALTWHAKISSLFTQAPTHLSFMYAPTQTYSRIARHNLFRSSFFLLAASFFFCVSRTQSDKIVSMGKGIWYTLHINFKSWNEKYNI